MTYWVLKAFLTPVLRSMWRVKVEGAGSVPSSGPAILAPNHRSFLDSLFLPLVVRRRVTFVAKAEYFDSWKTKWFFSACGQIPIRRDGGNASEGALLAARSVLDRGGVFAIYPEGTRTRDGYLHRGHTGVARLALQTGAPLIPVGLVGTDEVQPTDKKLPSPGGTVWVRFGKPIDTSRYRNRPQDRLVLRQLTDELMYEIRELSGYEYVDTYATKQAGESAPHDLPAPPVQLATLERVAS